MPVAELVLVALLVTGLAVALVAPAPRERRPFEAVLLGLLACGLYLVAAAVAIELSPQAGSLLVAPGVVVFCLSCWLSRGADHRGGGSGDGGADGDEPGPDSPIDWAEFDRFRAEWARTPMLVG